MDIEQAKKLAASAVDEAVAQWLEANKPSKIKEKVFAILDRKVEEAVAKHLGFNNRWGDKWEVDHCNGRSGQSYVGEWVSAKVGQAVSQFFEQANVEQLMPDQQEILDALKKDFLDKVDYEIRGRIRSKAEQHLDTYLNNVLEETSYDDLT